MKPKFYEANLGISCVDGAVEGIISHDAARLLSYLKERDHEGSSVGMSIRYDPDSPVVHIDNPEEVYKILQDLVDEDVV